MSFSPQPHVLKVRTQAIESLPGGSPLEGDEGNLPSVQDLRGSFHGRRDDISSRTEKAASVVKLTVGIEERAVRKG